MPLVLRHAGRRITALQSWSEVLLKGGSVPLAESSDLAHDRVMRNQDQQRSLSTAGHSRGGCSCMICRSEPAPACSCPDCSSRSPSTIAPFLNSQTLSVLTTQSGAHKLHTRAHVGLAAVGPSQHSCKLCRRPQCACRRSSRAAQQLMASNSGIALRVRSFSTVEQHQDEVCPELLQICFNMTTIDKYYVKGHLLRYNLYCGDSQRVCWRPDDRMLVLAD